MNRKDIFEETGENVIIYNDGTVLWHSYKNLKTFVHVKTTYYPFEVQTFNFYFSKLYFDDTYQQNYYSSKDNVTEHFVSNGEWVFNHQRGKTTRRCIKAQYRNGKIFSDIIWQFEMDRRQLYYFWSFFIPAIALSIVSLVTFLLPVKSSEKLTLAVFCFISFAVLIRLFNESLPSTSDNICNFGRLLSLNLGLSGLVIIVNGMISSVYHRKCPIWCLYLFFWTCKNPLDEDVHQNKTYTATPMQRTEDTPDSQTDHPTGISHEDVEPLLSQTYHPTGISHEDVALLLSQTDNPTGISYEDIELESLLSQTDNPTEISHEDIEPILSQTDNPTRISHEDVAPLLSQTDNPTGIPHGDVEPILSQTDNPTGIPHEDVEPILSQTVNPTGISDEDVELESLLSQTDNPTGISHEDIEPILSRSTHKSMLEDIKNIKNTIEKENKRQRKVKRDNKIWSRVASNCDIFWMIVLFVAYAVVYIWISVELFC